MDEIELRAVLDETDAELGEPPETLVSVHINGEDLRAIIASSQRDVRTRRWETEDSAREECPSLDEWLAVDNWDVWLDLSDVAPPSRHWLGEPGEWLEEQGLAAVLTCSCGMFGCGGVAARIALEHDTVTWSEFRFANAGPVVPIGPFTFDPAAYEAAIAAL